MNSKFKVNIELAKGTLNEYIVKDVLGISIGRIYILELSEENKYCSLRLSFYKKGNDSKLYLKSILNDFVQYLFYKNHIYKLNILVNEDINTNAFIELSFYLEGIINSSRVVNHMKKSEFLFGIDLDTFRKRNLYKDLILEGKNIVLKLLTPINAEELLQYYIKNKEHLRDFEPTRDNSFYTLESQKKALMDSYKQYLNGDSIEMGIYKDNKFIGKIKLSNIVMGILRNCIVGYSIDKDFEGRGYMKEALNIIVDYAFNELDIHRIEASTLTNNLRSQSVLKNCGFKMLGLNKDYLYINGEWQDHNTYYIVSDSI